VLEREPHAQVSRQAQGADNLSGAQLPGHQPSTVRTHAPDTTENPPKLNDTADVIAASQFPAFYGWTSADLVGPGFARFAEHALTGTVAELFGADRPAWLRSQVVEGHAG
jgi:hypothetical protein